MECVGMNNELPVLSSVVIPDGILAVKFQNNENITELTIPNTVTGMMMITDCPSLKTLKIGSGLSAVSMPNDSNIEAPFIIPGEGV